MGYRFSFSIFLFLLFPLLLEKLLCKIMGLSGCWNMGFSYISMAHETLPSSFRELASAIEQ